MISNQLPHAADTFGVGLHLVDENLALLDPVPSPHGNGAWQCGEQKGHTPAPGEHQLRPQTRVQQRHQCAGKGPGDLAPNGDHAHRHAQRLHRGHLHHVGRDGRDLTPRGDALHCSQANQKHQAQHLEVLPQVGPRQQTLPNGGKDHARKGEVHSKFPPAVIADKAKDDSSQGPCNKGDSVAQPGAHCRSSKEIGRDLFLHVAVDAKLVPLQSVSQQKRPRQLQEGLGEFPVRVARVALAQSLAFGISLRLDGLDGLDAAFRHRCHNEVRHLWALAQTSEP
mmetsp:Transcript_127163/g.302057  ORF Transcript_127163/g.302057 Transcript_127163/m.302057 type:complete len:281 (-) Transcript_127163:8-850(-)